MFNGRAAATWLLLSAVACGQQATDPAIEPLRSTLLQQRFDDFKIIEVVDESAGQVIRINIGLTPPTDQPSEVSRRTRNAMSAVRAVTGDDHRVAVWTYDEDSSTVLGMAFFSPLSETMTYKTADELQ